MNVLALKPRYLFLEVTTECNLRCKQCHMWMSSEPVGTLSTAEKLRVVDEFAAWAGVGMVVMTGGEPFKKTDEVLAISRRARSLGLTSAVNTNGTMIDESLYDMLLMEGPHYLVLSIDAPVAEIHDWIRGERGTFERVTGLLRGLVGRRASLDRASDMKVLVNAIVCARTLPLATQHVEFVRGLGADGITFQALGRTFMNHSQNDPFFDAQRPTDHVLVERVIDELIALRERDPFLLSETQDLAWMKPYFRDPDFSAEPVCGSAHRNVMVNMYGEVQLCFSMKDLVGGRALGDIRRASLRELWSGEDAARTRGVMDACRKNCGMLHCHRREASR